MELHVPKACARWNGSGFPSCRQGRKGGKSGGKALLSLLIFPERADSFPRPPLPFLDWD